ncbi:amidase family protein [Azospirillum sp. SYSU D00513]|uniref:amidase n=1 Tax=Azospirillum sp. SYSU D00513 TaxID=2812561 RepID=UPI001FFEB6CF|nr:amidase family protein [Azospirillum sp. SYSU D00513]
MDDLIRLTARQAVALLERREVSPLELIDAAERRAAATDGALNALPTRCFERARERAAALPKELRPGPGQLHGLPVAIKDLADVAGVRTTRGSTVFADRVPERSDIVVEILESRGALVVAKSNTPEFGAGAQTFNEVFGTTRNPWNTALTPGGSSGGSASALASGQVWLAHGTDLGGSLRIPASFCGVVGLRPSLGRVAHGPSALPFADLDVHGPMGRTVGDVALMLDAMSGQHPADPWSREAPARPFVTAVDEPVAPRRVAWSPDMGMVPVDPAVRAACAAAVARFTEAGAAVEEACIDFRDAEPVFQTLRAAGYAMEMAPLLAERRDALKPEVVWNIEKGLALSAGEIGRAARARGDLLRRTAAFFETHDLLVTPTVLVPPFDCRVRYIAEAQGVKFETYISWLALTFAVTLTGCPALSLPCGFTPDGLPVGLQLVGPPGGEHRLLSAAALLEGILGLGTAVPIDPREPAPPPA